MELSNLKLGTELSDFVLKDIHDVPEAEAIAYLFEHKPSGSKLMWLACSDTNRAFAITFKTPPKDNTGVFHIIEHSVLDGSKKFPLHEPFVNLLKTSMQTFLNALTFSDKTMYPVASTNVNDLENLIDVYLDAVFHPNLHMEDYIFSQEGWHLEADETGEIGINGVVLNEMKGALSDPEDVLAMHLKRKLFPDSAYGYESGGNPNAIPNLTLEEFRNTHKRHYTLENAYSFLYGDLDIERELQFLTERYAEVEPQQEKPNELSFQRAVSPDPYTHSMPTTPENALVGLGYVIGSWKDRETVLGTTILLEALMGSNEAPLKKALLEEGFGSDIQAYLFDGILQPFVVFEVKGAKPDCAEAFKAKLIEACERIASEGILAERLEAALAQTTFGLRERDFGYPDGVAYAINAMSSWLYDEKCPYDYLHYEKTLEDLTSSIGLGVFEKLLRRIVVENNHSALVSIKPEALSSSRALKCDKKAEEERIAKASVEEVVSSMKELQEKQRTPDTPEALAKIPQLGLSDIEAAPALPPIIQRDDTAIPSIHYELKTHGITYANFYFDLAALDWREIPYVGMLTALLGKLDTRHHSAEELDTLVNLHLGNLAFSALGHFAENDPLGSCSAKLLVEAAAIDEEIDALAQIPMEICEETIFDDFDRIFTILQQQRVELEQYFLNAGNSAALNYMRANFSATFRLNEALGGIAYYRFLQESLGEWEKKKMGICEVLRNLAGRIFKGNRARVSLAGNKKTIDAFWESAGDFGLMFSRFDPKEQLAIPDESPKNIGFTIPSDISFVVFGGALQNTNLNATGMIAAKALTYSYLWEKVRVVGGAYGAGFIPSPSGLFGFYSYRDPNITSTIEAYKQASLWLKSWKPQTNELAGYIVSSIASLDAPQKPIAEMKKLDALFFTGRPFTWLEQIRKDLLNIDVSNVQKLGSALSESGPQCAVCVLGAKEALEKAVPELHIEELL